MSDKFKYAPGKPGFGSKGDRGEDGQQGLSMYFTDLDPVNNVTIINGKITNDQVLWSSSSSILPSGRVYETGDLFFDSDGKCYEINASTNTFTYKFAELTLAGFFSPLGVTTNNDFERYFNNNTTPKYIIDNIYTDSGGIDYSLVPNTIYGINTYNFTRIEYCNVESTGDYNPFTVYSSGETPITDDHKALAIVRDYTTNTFRIGNLDNNGNIRNINLIFDVSLLRQTKESGNSFNTNTPEGTILTNYEINANSLFDNNFESNPSDFYAVYDSANLEASLYWTLTSFTNDSDVKGTMFFFTTQTPFNGNSYTIDASIVQPLIFHDIDSSGEINISGLDNTKSYSYYMKLSKNGWSRNSDIQYIYGGSFAIYPETWQSTDVSTGYGPFTGDDSIGFFVDSDITWTPAFYENPSTFMTNLAYNDDGADHDGSIFVELTENEGTDRTGIMRITTQSNDTIDVSIWQKGPITLVSFDTIATVDNWSSDGAGKFEGNYDSSITQLNMPTGDNVTHVSIDISVLNAVRLKNTYKALTNWSNTFYLYDVNDTLLDSFTSSGALGGTGVTGTFTDSDNGRLYVADVSTTDFPLKVSMVPNTNTIFLNQSGDYVLIGMAFGNGSVFSGSAGDLDIAHVSGDSISASYIDKGESKQKQDTIS